MNTITKRILIASIAILCVFGAGIFLANTRSEPGPTPNNPPANNGQGEANNSESEIISTQPPSYPLASENTPAINLPIPPAPTHTGYSWVAAPIFDAVGQFDNGFAVVRLDGKYGIINSAGQVVVPFIYELLGNHGLVGGYVGTVVNMSSGFVEARLDGQWGIIDMAGRVVIPFEYDEIFLRHEYKAAIVIRGDWPNWSQGLIELTTGREIIPVGTYNHVQVLSSSFATMVIRDDTWTEWHEGLIDMATGEEIIPPTYRQISIFSDGLAAVSRGGGWGFINAYGYEVIPTVYDEVMTFANGLAWVSSGGLWGIIDTNGNFVLPPTFESMRFTSKPSDELVQIGARGQDGFELWGFFDMTTLEIVVPMKYRSLWINGENRAEAITSWPETREESRSIIILDIAENREIATLTYYFGDGGLSNFHGNHAIFHIGEGWGDFWRAGLIDRDGREVLPPIYYSLRHFSDTLLIIDDNPLGRFRQQGRLVDTTTWEDVLPWHDHIGLVHDGIAAINTGGEWIQFSEWMNEIINGYWGFIDETGQIIIPPVLEFQRAASVSEGIAAVQVDDKWGFIRIG